MGRETLERSEETYKYDECNRLTVHDITGFRNDGTQENTQNLYTYDMQGNMLSDGNRQYSYDVRNRLAEVRTADGSWQKNHYDGEGLRAELEENGRLVRFIYDSMGNRLTEKRYTMPQEMTGMSGATHTIRYEYDRSNRLVRVSDCTGAAVTYHYGKHGLVDRERVRTGGDTWKETRYLHDAQGRVTKAAKVLSDGVYSITEYKYDRNGNITEVTMPEGGRISYAYDAEDRPMYETHEGGCISSSFTYAYDKTGNLVSVMDVDGSIETYAYDLLNRETRRTARDGGVRGTLYDKKGNAVRRINPVQYLPDKSGFAYSYNQCNNNRAGGK